MENKEKIIEKIRKVVELSKNNPSEEEAKAAALKAQEMLAQYHITMADIEDTEGEDDIAEVEVAVPNGKKWKYELARAVSKNFRCRHYLLGTKYIVFYGHEVDAKIASDVFKYLFEVGNKGANKAYTQAKKTSWNNEAAGIRNSYRMGFMKGVREALDKQCTALMIVVPKEVNEGFEEKTANFKHKTTTLTSSNFNPGVYSQGYEEGRRAMASRSLEVAS